MAMDTIKIELPEPWAGWVAEMRSPQKVSARVLIELQSEDQARIYQALEKLIVSHTFKDMDGNAAESVLDAPVSALAKALEIWGGKLGSLDPR